MFIVGALYLVFDRELLSEPGSKSSVRLDEQSRIKLSIQLGLVLLSIIVTKSSIDYIRAGNGLPLGVLVVGWATLISSLMFPGLFGTSNRHYVHRLVVVFLQFAPTFIILTLSYEGLFYCAFCLCLFSWMRLEYRVHLHNTPNPKIADVTVNPLKPAVDTATNHIATATKQGTYRALSLSDARIALFFFYFIQSAFFSASNIASVSSFSLEAVSRLVPVFDPFSQGTLLMLKLMVPFAALSANFGLLNKRLGIAPSALFMVVMAVSDVMTMSFFWMVKDEGSWLEIGTTISHFFIASLLGVFVAGLEVFSEFSIRGVEFGGDGEQRVEGRSESHGVGNGGTNGKVQEGQ